MGNEHDGYIGSNKRLLSAYKSRPHTFRRRILARVEFNNHAELLSLEQNWLSLIKVEELGRKYYNEKRVAAGGDIISTLPIERQLEHREKSILARNRGAKKWREENPELVSANAKHARSCVKSPHQLPALPGESNPFYGKHHTEETKKKISAAKAGTTTSWKGGSHTAETRLKVSLNNPNRKSIVTPHGTFASAEEFERVTGLCTANSIRSILKLNHPITPHQVFRSKLFTTKDIGKTPSEIGYAYD
jgi:hypothetical protein